LGKDLHDYEEEPALHFHEFIFLLGLIATKCIVTQEGNIESKLREFYTNKLNFKQPNQLMGDLTYE